VPFSTKSNEPRKSPTDSGIACRPRVRAADRPADWNQWFKSFDGNNRALLVQDRTARGQQSNFNKLVSRESVTEGLRPRPQGGGAHTDSRIAEKLVGSGAPDENVTRQDVDARPPQCINQRNETAQPVVDACAKPQVHAGARQPVGVLTANVCTPLTFPRGGRSRGNGRERGLPEADPAVVGRYGRIGEQPQPRVRQGVDELGRQQLVLKHAARERHRANAVHARQHLDGARGGRRQAVVKPARHVRGITPGASVGDDGAHGRAPVEFHAIERHVVRRIRP
jgi:hypothetical protein